MATVAEFDHYSETFLGQHAHIGARASVSSASLKLEKILTVFSILELYVWFAHSKDIQGSPDMSQP
ncbi:MAG TPA: hypothetical protein VM912_19305, partial [Terriglobales bacterium]|nr:hypothetical protein [Terriglobales bacterium]